MKPSKSKYNKYLKQKFKNEFLKYEHLSVPILKKDLYLAKCIIEHIRQWMQYTKDPKPQARPINAHYPLENMFWANNLIKKHIQKNSALYHNSTLHPLPLEDIEIAAAFLAMNIHGQPAGPNVKPIFGLNDRFVVVINDEK